MVKCYNGALQHCVVLNCIFFLCCLYFNIRGTYIFYELCICQHNEVNESIVHSNTCQLQAGTNAFTICSNNYENLLFTVI